VKHSLVSSLLLVLVALGFLGAQVPAIAPAESAREEIPSEEREAQALRNSTSRRAQTRAKDSPQLLLDLSELVRSAVDMAGSARVLRSVVKSSFYPGNLHLLQVRRI
jgi:hypothetical protein